MKRISILISSLLCLSFFVSCVEKENADTSVTAQIDTVVVQGDNAAGRMVSIQEYGVLASNSADKNKTALQKAIDEASKTGTALYVTPVNGGYKCATGVVLKKNVVLIGAQGPTGRGTTTGTQPTGSLFVISDNNNPFITVESGTKIQGIQFYYPDQNYTNGSKIIEYKPTIAVSESSDVDGAVLKDLSFYGEYFAMDFEAKNGHRSSDLLFENCYGFPLSGKFIAVSGCNDAVRMLHCHINPANMREFGRSYSSSIINAVVDVHTFAYSVDDAKDASLLDIFTFGTYGGLKLGANSSGALTSFNLDCVAVGVYKLGDSATESNWEISQGSIIANCGAAVNYVHPFIVTGDGHTSITAVNAFSGANGALTTIGKSWDYLYVTGQGYPTITLTSCSMHNYESTKPVTIKNGQAKIRATACNDKNNKFFTMNVDGGGSPAAKDDDGQSKYEPEVYEEGDPVSGQYTKYDYCETLRHWSSGGMSMSLDLENKQQGDASISFSGTTQSVVFIRSSKDVNSKTTLADGHLMFDFYISDITHFDTSKEGALELTSSGTCDKEEIAWHLKNISLHAGWNHIDLKLSTGGKTDGDIDLKHVNYMRMYSFGVTQQNTLKIDNIRFYQD